MVVLCVFGGSIGCFIVYLSYIYGIFIVYLSYVIDCWRVGLMGMESWELKIESI